MFDNRDPSEAHARSRAVEYAVDWQKRTLRMVWEQKVEDSIPFRLGWGSVQEVGDKEVVISWGDYPRTKGYCDSRTGNYPLFSHLTREGAKLFELRVPCGWFTYRAYFVPARP
jgi:hypothetical protein